MNVTQVSLLHVICCFYKTVSHVIDIPNKNYINVMYQLILCITVSANLKFRTETDILYIHTLIMFQEMTPTAVYFYFLIKAYLVLIMNISMTSTDVTINITKENCWELI